MMYAYIKISLLHCSSLHVFHLGDILTSVTVLGTPETLCLLDEDHQWSKTCFSLAPNKKEETTSGQATVREMQPISCVSSILLFTSDPCKVAIQFYDEVRVYSKKLDVPNFTGVLRLYLH